MLSDQLEAPFAAAPVLYLPYGMCAPHGPRAAELLARMSAMRPVTGPGLRTFEEVERFWSEAVAPILAIQVDGRHHNPDRGGGYPGLFGMETGTHGAASLMGGALRKTVTGQFSLGC